MSMKAPILLAIASLALAQQPQGKSVNFYSLEKEAELGQTFAGALRQAVTVIPDARVEQIGARLAAQADPFAYQFSMFDGVPDSSLRAPAAFFPRALDIDEALAVAGGPVFVPRKLLARNDGELAAILAHAVAHVGLRHPTRLLTKTELGQIGMIVAQQAAPQMQHRPATMDAEVMKLVRSFESEADLYAMQLLRKAGFDPRAMLAWIRSLPTPEKTLGSPYPPPEQRIAAIEKVLADSPRQ